MSNRSLLFILLLCFLVSCKAINTNKNTVSKHIKMKASDVEKIKRGEVFITVNETGRTIELMDIGDGYQEKIIEPNSPYSTILTYYKNTLGLKSEGKLFFRFYIGLHKEYSADGALIRQIDYDEIYAFTVDSLIELLLEDFNVDLRVPQKNLFVTRYINQSLSQYEYVLHLPIDDQSFRLIKIDCNNGNKILDKIAHYIE